MFDMQSFLHEIVDQQLTSLLSEVGLNIREAHVYCTTDGLCLALFVVDGWKTEVNFSHGYMKDLSISDFLHILYLCGA
jgi:hypothetical protein